MSRSATTRGASGPRCCDVNSVSPVFDAGGAKEKWGVEGRNEKAHLPSKTEIVQPALLPSVLLRTSIRPNEKLEKMLDGLVRLADVVRLPPEAIVNVGADRRPPVRSRVDAVDGRGLREAAAGEGFLNREGVSCE